MPLAPEVENVARSMAALQPVTGSYYHSSYPRGVCVVDSPSPYIVSFRLSDQNILYTVTSSGGSVFVTVRVDGSSVRTTFL